MCQNKEQKKIYNVKFIRKEFIKDIKITKKLLHLELTYYIIAT